MKNIPYFTVITEASRHSLSELRPIGYRVPISKTTMNTEGSMVIVYVPDGRDGRELAMEVTKEYPPIPLTYVIKDLLPATIAGVTDWINTNAANVDLPVIPNKMRVLPKQFWHSRTREYLACFPSKYDHTTDFVDEVNRDIHIVTAYNTVVGVLRVLGGGLFDMVVSTPKAVPMLLDLPSEDEITHMVKRGDYEADLLRNHGYVHDGDYLRRTNGRIHT